MSWSRYGSCTRETRKQRSHNKPRPTVRSMVSFPRPHCPRPARHA